MAKSIFNAVMDGASGSIGRLLIFRQRAGKTVIATRKKKVTGKTASAQQEKARERFADSIEYARLAMENPLLRKEFESRASEGQTGYNLAVADFYKKPVFIPRRTDVSACTGHAGDVLKVYLAEPARIISVTAVIRNSGGSEVEAAALVRAIEGPVWVYTTVTDFDPVGHVITFLATDRAGNTAQLVVPF